MATTSGSPRASRIVFGTAEEPHLTLDVSGLSVADVQAGAGNVKAYKPLRCVIDVAAYGAVTEGSTTKTASMALRARDAAQELIPQAYTQEGVFGRNVWRSPGVEASLRRNNLLVTTDDGSPANVIIRPADLWKLHTALPPSPQPNGDLEFYLRPGKQICDTGRDIANKLKGLCAKWKDLVDDNGRPASGKTYEDVLNAVRVLHWKEVMNKTEGVPPEDWETPYFLAFIIFGPYSQQPSIDDPLFVIAASEAGQVDQVAVGRVEQRKREKKLAASSSSSVLSTSLSEMVSTLSANEDKSMGVMRDIKDQLEVFNAMNQKRAYFDMLKTMYEIHKGTPEASEWACKMAEAASGFVAPVPPPPPSESPSSSSSLAPPPPPPDDDEWSSDVASAAGGGGSVAASAAGSSTAASTVGSSAAAPRKNTRSKRGARASPAEASSAATPSASQAGKKKRATPAEAAARKQASAEMKLAKLRAKLAATEQVAAAAKAKAKDYARKTNDDTSSSEGEDVDVDLNS